MSPCPAIAPPSPAPLRGLCDAPGTSDDRSRQKTHGDESLKIPFLRTCSLTFFFTLHISLPPTPKNHGPGENSRVTPDAPASPFWLRKTSMLRRWSVFFTQAGVFLLFVCLF